MEFKVVPVTADTREWSNLYRQAADIHYSPEYALVYSETDGLDVRAAISHDGASSILHPFVMRPLSSLPFGGFEGSFDLVQLYGFGGPILSGKDSSLMVKHCAAFEKWARENRVATEYANIHPLLPSQRTELLRSNIKLDFVKDVVVWNLKDLLDPIESVNRGHKSSIAHAKAAGVRVERVPMTAENLRIFRRIYDATMDRRGAANRWRFKPQYFANLALKLNLDRTSLFFAFAGREVASAYFLMHDKGIAYYHFGGSDERFFELRSSNFLMLETARWLKRQGYAEYHLGGGVTASPDDTLLRFKKGFSKEVAPLYSYSRILHNDLYNELNAAKKAFETQTLGEEVASDFFPLYRRGL